MSHERTQHDSRQTARGLSIGAPGGGAGWLARRIAPAAATKCYLAWIRLTRARAARRFIASCADFPDLPRFRHVEIETVNRCNGECAFCPVNRRDDPRPYAKMPEALFAKIIDELSAMDYSGRVGLFSNNEPLLDNRLEEFAGRARRSLPAAHLHLSTNGRLLNIDRLRRLLPLFDRIVVNNYGDRPEMHDNIREVRDFCRTGEGERLLENSALRINLRCGDDVLTSRAGSAPNRPPPRSPVSAPCHLPFSQLIVRPDGKVSLCCNDALGKTTLGDLNRESIGETWRSDARRAVCDSMRISGRTALPLCRMCDFMKHDPG